MLTDDQLQSVYTWVDSVPLSRPKRNIARDFSDGVLLAEIVRYYHPRLVDLHNYSPANGVAQKTYNWHTLAEKVFSVLGYKLSKFDVGQVVACHPGAIEAVLLSMKDCLSRYSARVLNASHSNKSITSGSHHLSTNNSPLPNRTREQNNKQQANEQTNHLRSSRTQNRDSQQQLSGSKDERLDKNEMNKSISRNRAIDHTRNEDEEQKRHSANRDDVNEDKDETIQELRETIEIMDMKINKLEQLVRLKDSKITALAARVERALG